MYTLLLAVLVLTAVLLVGAVLLQAGTGGGLAAMGGGASTDTFLGGRQAATILTKSTWWLGGIFLGLSLILAGLSTRSSAPRSVLEGEQTVPVPIAPPPQLPLDVEPAEQPPPQPN
ncbi:MAG: preprotein translocase subunit SecG [Gemmatimonadales bacterium]|nr:preprotein translocase subunit SecG [Gemmatimonadales bacterium]NIN50150.1 preprotein translocase subunit SecG [Gemmatimonadales bacterium]NIP07614.1 preprotein translocase subunit SecG [Gemmatimonadales bacterium]NIR01766.1 preprotein translocase subunit SecG [Gemmatimonadales bacterium]NIS65669.1 preprotein translocase subunit SecG [Gemmatimonadales bacterium]